MDGFFISNNSALTKAVKTILLENYRRVNFISLNDFTDRTKIGFEQINLLIRIGASLFLEKIKKLCFAIGKKRFIEVENSVLNEFPKILAIQSRIKMQY